MYLLDKDFKSVIINLFKELQEVASKGLNVSMRTMRAIAYKLEVSFFIIIDFREKETESTCIREKHHFVVPLIYAFTG